MEFLQRITITCFAASYLVTFTLELSRFVFRAPLRFTLRVGFVIAGLFAHTVFIFAQSRIDLLGGVPLSSWDSWCLVSAWLLAAIYTGSVIRQPTTPIGLILLPMCLVLILAGVLLQDSGSFSPAAAENLWNLIHGISLLLGTVAVSVGFAAGCLYLIESHRLKQKKAPGRRFRLPSLERTQVLNERCLILSTALLGIGLLSGIVLNSIHHLDDEITVGWTDPVVWSSGLLFAWLAAAATFNFMYKPARYGRKIAYLVVANFVFLVMVLLVVFTVEHGGTTEPETALQQRSPAVDREAAP